MYRIGHGDCFLLAFPGKTATSPKYVLIDCGYKPGSPAFITRRRKKITDNLRDATGGHIDVAIITHEHQDHVNAITNDALQGLHDRRGVVCVDRGSRRRGRQRPAEDTSRTSCWACSRRATLSRRPATPRRRQKIDSFLAFEFGGDDEQFNAAGAAAVFAAGLEFRQQAIDEDLQGPGVEGRASSFRPHRNILKLPGVENVRVFALGPPRDEELLRSTRPDRRGRIPPGVARSASAYFGAAARAAEPASTRRARSTRSTACRSRRIKALDGDTGEFFRERYGVDGDQPVADRLRREDEIEPNAAWRRIDRDWLYSADQLALDMNDYTNNSSLVLAFELGKDGKVLLFAADAQRGNWISWSKKSWKDGDETPSPRATCCRGPCSTRSGITAATTRRCTATRECEYAEPRLDGGRRPWARVRRDDYRRP